MMLSPSKYGVESCLNCSKYITCSDKKKAFTYICNKFKPVDKEAISSHLEHSGTKHKKAPKNLDALMQDPQDLQEFNISRMVNEVLNDKSIVPIDLRINDRHIPKAPNFYKFCVGEEFLNIVPFLEQALIGTILNAEYCSRCSDIEWMMHTHKVTHTLRRFEKKVALLENGVCPHCGATKSELVKDESINPYQELILICGQRSGKSAVTAMLCAYHIHRTVKLSKPNEVYGILSSSIQHINFVALSFAGAKNLLYDPLYNYMIEAPWFKQYHALLDEYQHKTGESIFKLNDTFCMYRHRALVISPCGPDRRALRGKTRSGASVDEICHFPNDANSDKVKMNASEVYIALERSLLTIRASANKLLAKGFNDVPTGMFWNISSPYSVRDKGMELLRASTNSKTTYGLQKSTFEMNPTITFEDLKDEYQKDIVTALRDYGAQPPLQSNAFITSDEKVAACFGTKTNGIIVSMSQKKYKNGQAERYGKIKGIKDCPYPSILGIDAGYTNNSFALVCGHNDEEGNFVTTILCEIMPLPGIPINYNLLYENIMLPIVEAQNVVLVCADRWNSLKFMSDLRSTNENLVTEIYSLKYKDLWFARDYVLSGKLILPKLDKTVKECLEYDIENYPRAFDGKPTEHLVLQMLTVRDTGSAVIKGDGNMTDDIFRALALAITRINEPKHSELFSAEHNEENKPKLSHLAISKGCSNIGVASSRAITGSTGKVIAVSRRSRG